MSTFQLGQRVRYATYIRRRDSWPGEFTGPNRLWSSEAYPGKEHDGGEGIIVGKRTLSNGNADYSGYEGQPVYRGTDYFTAYLIAYDMRRKPVFVRPEDIEPLEATR